MQAELRENTLVLREGNHSSSYYLAIGMGLLTLLYYYLPFILDFYNSYVLFAAAIVAALAFILFRGIKLRLDFLLPLSLFILTSLCSYFWNTSGVLQVMYAFTILLYLYVFHADPLRKREQNIVLIMFTVITFFVLLNGDRGAVIYGGNEGKFNPNTCGLMLSMLFFAGVSKYVSERKISLLIFSVVCFLVQFLFLCRTALMGEAIFLVGLLITRARKKTFRRSTVFWTIFLFSIGGVIFAWLYADVLFSAVGYGKITILGKDLFTGRQAIWQNALQRIRNNPIFGVGGQLGVGEDEIADSLENAHNQPLGILAAFGLLPFLFFYVALALLAALPYCNGHGSRQCNRVPAIFLFTITVMCYFELLFSAQWGAILMAYPIILSCSISRKTDDAKLSRNVGIPVPKLRDAEVK